MPPFGGAIDKEVLMQSLSPTAIALVFLLGPAAGFAAEDPHAHARGATHTITLEADDVRPGTTTIAHGDSVSFVNYSTDPVRVTFIDPPDLEKKVRCAFIRQKGAQPEGTPWALFTWEEGKLIGDIPPGRFASLCSFEPGKYAFTATSLGQRSRSAAGGSVLAPKGRLEVK